MRVGVHIPCYKFTHFLPAVLKSVAWMDRILVTNSTVPWDDSNSQVDNTEEICNKADMPNLELLKGTWSQDSEHMQRTLAGKLLSDCDRIFLLDSDEIMLVGEQKRLLEYSLANNNLDTVGVNTIPYFDDLSHVAKYDEGNTPIAIMKPGVKFYVTRCADGVFHYNRDFNIHHFKFLQPKDQIGWRVKAKHIDQQRTFNGVVPCEKNIELEEFMKTCGYNEFKSEIKESEVGTA